MFPLSHMMKSFIQKGRLEVIDADGGRHVFAGVGEGPRVVMRLTDRALYRKLVFNPELNAGEAYTDGRMRFEEGTHLRDFLKLFFHQPPDARLLPAAEGAARDQDAVSQAPAVECRRRGAEERCPSLRSRQRLLPALPRRADALFLRLFPQLTTETLEQAQRNKLRLIAAKLGLEPGQTVLDIGCGWGDMALYLAQIADVKVLGVTLSKEQQALASERAAEMGLSDRVRFELADYRDLNERFDRIVSVGMFEHVGVHHYDEFFKQLNRLMKDDGLALIHSIGHMSPPGMASPWLRKYIFPGAYSPALSEVFAAVEENSLWVSDVEVLRVHYAKTLAHWDKRFQANRDAVVAMYDESFARMWEFYLISAEMMFRTGSQMVFHMQLCRQRDAAQIVRDYTVDVQRAYEAIERDRGM